MIEQRGDSIVITGQSMLGRGLPRMLLGIAHRRANGVPSGDLQQLARLLYRAYMSPQRHEIATAADNPACSNGQDRALIATATAAEILG